MDVTEARILELRRILWTREFVFSILWKKMPPGTWSPRDRKEILVRIFKDPPTIGSLKPCINRLVGQFLRKREERRTKAAVMEVNPALKEIFERFSSRSKDPDIKFIYDWTGNELTSEVRVVFTGLAGKIWKLINKRLYDWGINERWDVMNEVLVAFRGVKAEEVDSSLWAWLKGVIEHKINDVLRGKMRETANRAWGPTRPKNRDNKAALCDHRIPYTNDEVPNDDWLGNQDASKGSGHPDSFSYGQYPEAAWDDFEFYQGAKEIMGDRAPYFFARERGAKIRDQVRLLNAAARMRAERLATPDTDDPEFNALLKEFRSADVPIPKEITRNIVKKALETAKRDLGKRLPKRSYRSRKKFGAK